MDKYSNSRSTTRSVSVTFNITSNNLDFNTFPGWNQPLFACSYKINFIQLPLPQKLQKARRSVKKIISCGRDSIDKAAVYIDVCGIHSSNSSRFHDRLNCKHTTSILSSNVTLIQISSASSTKELNHILSSIDIFFRRIPSDLGGPIYGEVVRYHINFFSGFSAIHHSAIHQQNLELRFKLCECNSAKVFDNKNSVDLLVQRCETSIEIARNIVVGS